MESIFIIDEASLQILYIQSLLLYRKPHALWHVRRGSPSIALHCAELWGFATTVAIPERDSLMVGYGREHGFM
jgi:hypothetical protein